MSGGRHFSCPLCQKDLGYYGIGHDGTGDWDERCRGTEYHIQNKHPERVELVRRAFMLDEANVPSRYRRPSPPPTDEPGRAAWEEVGVWVRECPESNLILHGPPGVGKTTLAAQAFLHEIKSETSLPLEEVSERYWLHAGDFTRGARRLVATGKSTELADLTDRVHRVWLLVIDDLGAERVTDFARDLIADLIEMRYEAELPSLVTSNFGPDELAERLADGDPWIGDRLVGRLCENAMQVPVGGPDRRLPPVSYLPTPSADEAAAGTASP